jgi:hypothetical protein
LFIANPNRRWTATSPTNPIILWMILSGILPRYSCKEGRIRTPIRIPL